MRERWQVLELKSEKIKTLLMSGLCCGACLKPSIGTDTGLVCPVPAETVPPSAPAHLSLSDTGTFSASLCAVADAGPSVLVCGSLIGTRRMPFLAARTDQIRCSSSQLASSWAARGCAALISTSVCVSESSVSILSVCVHVRECVCVPFPLLACVCVCVWISPLLRLIGVCAYLFEHNSIF